MQRRAMADVDNKSLGRTILYGLVVLGLFLSYLILRPFLVAITWAVMFAILFHRMQLALTSKMGPARAAGITTSAIGILIVAPAVLLMAVLAREAPQVADHLKQ